MPTDRARRRLTVRQVAVLAAIDRRRECTLLDLRDDFPGLPPSAALRAVDALAGRGLVNRVGVFSEVYLGGVVFSPARRGEGSLDIPI